MAPPAPLISARELNRATLARQGLLEPMRTRRTTDAIERLGSLQAQHPEWPPIALASRAADAVTADLAGALDRREVVRSSLMRITIHVVSANDLWPMFTVCQPARLEQWRHLLKADPVDSALGRRITAAHAVAVAALAERPRSSLELDRLMSAEVGPFKSPIARTTWRHLAAFVPLVHVPHSGEGYGRSLYAVAADWLGMTQPQLDPEEARRHLARRYLAAFGPASVDDLVAYVGRGGGIGPWRAAVEGLDDELVVLCDEAGRTLYDLAAAPRPGAEAAAPPRLLARWDSLLLSHGAKHRGRMIDDAHRPAVYSKNADVRPTFLLDGMVAGTWELRRANGSAEVTLRPFRPVQAAAARALVQEAERLLEHIAPDAERRAVRMAR